MAVRGREGLDEACLVLDCALKTCVERVISLISQVTNFRRTLLLGSGKRLASRFMARSSPSYWRPQISARPLVGVLLIDLRLDVHHPN
jgi:hypothetical protein